MPNSVLTKKILADSLKKLMQSIPFSKISISDIVNECGMNRNTFYYHFKDKYELLNWIFFTEAAQTLNQQEVLELSGWALIDRLNRYFYENRVFYANAMSYEGQNSFVDYFKEILQAVIQARSDLPEEDDPQFAAFYTDFLVDFIVLTVVRWIREGAKYPPEQFAFMLKKAATSAAMMILKEEDGGPV